MPFHRSRAGARRSVAPAGRRPPPAAAARPPHRATHRSLGRARVLASGLLAVCLAGLAGVVRAEPLRVVTTVPDLADLCRAVGGDDVRVRALVKGPQDPHFVEPRPSFIRDLHRADLFALVGLELEIGWVPPLLQAARNSRILPGGPGYLDGSSAIRPLGVPPPGATRAQGDLHRFGSPHYLSDPLAGLQVAELIRDRLSELRPEAADRFAEHFRDFEHRLLAGLVGDALAAAVPPAELRAAVEEERIEALAAERGVEPGGLFAEAAAFRGARAVEDHSLWIYFARRFGLELVATLEPKPGIAPTTRHLAEVVELVRSRGVPLILTSPYFDIRHARFVADRTGARIVAMAHQVGSRPGADTYLDTVAYNVRAVREALAAGGDRDDRR